MKIEYSKKAAKYISALDQPTKQRIKAGIEGLAVMVRMERLRYYIL